MTALGNSAFECDQHFHLHPIPRESNGFFLRMDPTDLFQPSEMRLLGPIERLSPHSSFIRKSGRTDLGNDRIPVHLQNP